MDTPCTTFIPSWSNYFDPQAARVRTTIFIEATYQLLAQRGPEGNFKVIGILTDQGPSELTSEEREKYTKMGFTIIPLLFTPSWSNYFDPVENRLRTRIFVEATHKLLGTKLCDNRFEVIGILTNQGPSELTPMEIEKYTKMGFTICSNNS